MDKNLMAKEDLTKLGFLKVNEEDAKKRQSEVVKLEAARTSGANKEDEGFIVIKDSLKNQTKWRKPTILGKGDYSILSFSNPFKRTS